MRDKGKPLRTGPDYPTIYSRKLSLGLHNLFNSILHFLAKSYSTSPFFFKKGGILSLFSRALWDISAESISMNSRCPGLIKLYFSSVSGFESSMKIRSAYGWSINYIKGNCRRLCEKNPSIIVSKNNSPGYKQKIPKTSKRNKPHKSSRESRRN